MKVDLVRTHVKRVSMEESELVDFIRERHEDCGVPSCALEDAIKNNLNNSKLIDAFLDVDGANGFMGSQEGGGYAWMSVPTSGDTTEL